MWDPRQFFKLFTQRHSNGIKSYRSKMHYSHAIHKQEGQKLQWARYPNMERFFMVSSKNSRSQSALEFPNLKSRTMTEAYIPFSVDKIHYLKSKLIKIFQLSCLGFIHFLFYNLQSNQLNK